MPLDNMGSYPVVMREVLAHWEDVDAELGAGGELTLQGGYTRGMFLADQAAVQEAISALAELENGRQTAAAHRDLRKAAVRPRLGQFRAMLRATIPGSKYLAAAPKMPPLDAVASRFLAAFDDMQNVWGRINADGTLPGFTPPLVIGGYTLAAFTAELASLRDAFLAVTTADNELDIGRQGRDALLRPARERMVQYRAAVEAVFGPAHPLTLSRPVLFSGR